MKAYVLFKRRECEAQQTAETKKREARAENKSQNK